MRQSEYKKRYDPEMGRKVKEHIYGEGIWDSIKSVGSKVFGKTAKKAASNAASKAVSKVSEHVGEKAGDKIIMLLHKKKAPAVQSVPTIPVAAQDQPLSDYDVTE